MTAFLCTNNEISERECKQFFSKIILTIKYSGRNLTKKVKDLYAENYKTLIKEAEDNTKKWKAIPCSWEESYGC